MTGPRRPARSGRCVSGCRPTMWTGCGAVNPRRKGPDLCAEMIINHPLFRLLSATAYPNAGASLNTRGDTSKVYGGFLLQWETHSVILFFNRIGPGPARRQTGYGFGQPEGAGITGAVQDSHRNRLCRQPSPSDYPCLRPCLQCRPGLAQ